jgi:hypothetical protein
MRYALILSVVSIAVAAGCSMDPLVYRIGSDYLPVDTPGNTWTYEISAGGERTVTVKGADVMLGRDCTRVEVDFENNYWYRDDDHFDEYVKTTYLFNEEFVLEERWRRHLDLPLVLHNTWTDAFENTVLVYGQPVTRTVNTDAEVIATRDVTVSAGKFEQCYVVRLEQVAVIETPYGNGSVDSTFVEEYYAPGIGLIKSVNLLTGTEEVLKSYFVK